MIFAKVRADHCHPQLVHVNLRGEGIYIKGTLADDLIKSIHLLSLPGERCTQQAGWLGQCKAWNPLSKQCFSWLDRSNNTWAG